MTATNISSIRAAMSRRGLRPRRRLGQNFLKERGIHELMVRAAEIGPTDVVLEVGCGPGCLTESLLDAGARVLAVEIDGGLLDVARELLEGREGVVWHRGDALRGKHDLDEDLLARIEEMAGDGAGGFKLVANLPYSISVPVVVNGLECGAGCTLEVVMVQDEVAERLLAGPGTPEYGPAGVTVRVLAEAERLRRIGPAAFWPRPKVDSSVVKIAPCGEPPLDGRDYEDFKTVVRGIFAQRRKLWPKSLTDHLGRAKERDWRKVFEKKGFDTRLRAERLHPAEIVRLARTAREAGLLR